MGDVLSKTGEGLSNAFLMAWEVWWALVLGFAISAVVQSWVPRERIEAALSGSGIVPLAKATTPPGPGAAEARGAISIARSADSTSIMRYPARNSLASGNGPSVTAGAPAPSWMTILASSGPVSA